MPPSRASSTEKRKRKPVAPPTAKQRATALLGVTPNHEHPKVYDLIQLWIHDGIDFKQACRAIGWKVETARRVLHDPKVRQRFRDELQVLRESQRAPSIHRLIKLRDTASSERVQLEAARVLLADSEGGSASVQVNVAVVPGYVIDLSGDAQNARVGRVPGGVAEQVPEIATTYDVISPDVQSGGPSEDEP